MRLLLTSVRTWSSIKQPWCKAKNRSVLGLGRAVTPLCSGTQWLNQEDNYKISMLTNSAMRLLLTSVRMVLHQAAVVQGPALFSVGIAACCDAAAIRYTVAESEKQL